MCARCGYSLGNSALPQLCPSCGARTDPLAAACRICGARWEAVRAPRNWWRVAAVAAVLAAAVTVAVVWRLAPRVSALARDEVVGRWSLLADRARAMIAPPSAGESPTVLVDTTRQPVSTMAVFGLLPSATSRVVAPNLPTSVLTLLSLTTVPEATHAPSPTVTTALSGGAALSATPLTASVVVHVVQKGDTLGALGVRYGVKAEEIARTNGLSFDGVLSLGQKLVIPGVFPATPTATLPAPTSTPTAASTPTVVPSQTSLPTASPTPAAALGGVAALIAAERQARATNTATAAPLPTVTPRVHTMVQGEHIGILAIKYGVTTAEIAKANGISEEAILSVGQRLVIPEPGSQVSTSLGLSATPTPNNRTPLPKASPTPASTFISHVVAKGDTLGGIAVRYGVDSQRIADANGITLGTVLSLGQTLRIPGASAGVAPTRSAALVTPSVSAMSPRPATPTLTPLPTSAFRYRTPTLLWPTNGAAIAGNSAPLLNWTSVGILADPEWYELRLWMPGQPDEPTVVYTKATSYRVAERVSLQARRTRHFSWQVTVVLRNAPGSAVTPVSAASEVCSFVLE